MGQEDFSSVNAEKDSVNENQNVGDTAGDLKTEQGFTPGPWSVHDGVQSKCKCLSVSGGQHPIASVESGEWGDSYPSIRQQKDTGSIEGKFEAYIERIPYGEIPEEEALANARLIAAAPELHYALGLLLASHTDRDDECVAVKRARAALDHANMPLPDPPEVKSLSMPRLDFICDKCGVQQFADGICANCGANALRTQTTQDNGSKEKEGIASA